MSQDYLITEDTEFPKQMQAQDCLRASAGKVDKHSKSNAKWSKSMHYRVIYHA